MLTIIDDVYDNYADARSKTTRFWQPALEKVLKDDSPFSDRMRATAAQIAAKDPSVKKSDIQDLIAWLSTITKLETSLSINATHEQKATTLDQLLSDQEFLTELKPINSQSSQFGSQMFDFDLYSQGSLPGTHDDHDFEHYAQASDGTVFAHGIQFQSGSHKGWLMLYPPADSIEKDVEGVSHILQVSVKKTYTPDELKNKLVFVEIKEPEQAYKAIKFSELPNKFQTMIMESLTKAKSQVTYQGYEPLESFVSRKSYGAGAALRAVLSKLFRKPW